MPQSPSEPSLTVEWRHGGYRLIRFFLSDAISEETRAEIVRSLSNVAHLDSVDLVRNQVDSIALEKGLRASYATTADHCDPLGEWITVGLVPSN